MSRRTKRSRHRAAISLVVAGIFWVVVNDPIEGPVLVTFKEGRGLTTADLASLAAFGLAGWLW